ncbi:MAG TPA: hypothetical protein VKX46_06955 [Ktedonobacteraceae bacterium]|nr:hypothetical protein [Ktedonobacteraceae bacterium]
MNTQFPAVELCRREKHDLWSFRTFGPTEQIELANLDDIHFPVAAVYEDVSFPDGNHQPA